MEKESIVIEQSKFAYKSAARSFIVLTTIILIFYLSLFKLTSDPNFDAPKKGYALKEFIPKIEQLKNQLPFGQFSTVDSKVFDTILEWGFVPESLMIERQSCDSKGCFYYLFLPTEDKITMRTLLERFQSGIRILRKESDLNGINLNDIFFSNFILRANELDSAVLASRYHHKDYNDSVTELVRKNFTLIDFKRQFDKVSLSVHNPNDVNSTWLSVLNPLNNIWNENKDSLNRGKDVVFSCNNINELGNIFINKKTKSEDIEFGNSFKINREEAYIIMPWLVLAMVFITWWFWWKARTMELLYLKSINNISSKYYLSSLSSGIYHLLESNTFANLLGNSNRYSFKFWFLVIWCCLAFLVELLFLVALPSFTAIVVPELLPSLISGILYNKIRQ